MFNWKSIYAFSWDVAERGIDNSVAEFKTLGLNSVTIAGSYHAGKFIHPRSKSPIKFPEDGTVYFRTDPSLYGKIKPIHNSSIDNIDILQDLGRNEDLSLNAWLVLLHNSNLGELNQNDCVKNAFGDTYHYNLCPSSPNAREYAIGLAKDVSTNYQIDGISIESPGFLPFVHGYHHEFNLVDPNSWLMNLFGLCFCDYCQQGSSKKGIKLTSLKDLVKTWITEYLGSEVNYPDDMAERFWLADIATNSELTAFMNWRCEVVTSLVKEIRAAVPKDINISVIPSIGRPTANAWYEGSNLPDLIKYADHLEICLYEPTLQRAMADFFDIKRRLRSAKGLRCILRPSYPDLTPSEVTSMVNFLKVQGIDGISFYNWGFLRQSSLNYIRQTLNEV